MTAALRFQPPSIAWRGKLARLRAEAQSHKPEHGEARGQLRCTCGSTIHFNIQSTGISRGRCSAGCGIRWSE
jgi:hypothetical protein